MKRKRVVIVAGGDFHSMDAKRINPMSDLIVAADGGAQRLASHGIWPHLLVGDLDSLKQEQVNVISQKIEKIERIPKEKDVTDTHYACQKALLYNPSEIALFGVWGGARIDHALANIGLLEWLSDREAKAIIYSGTNRIQMVKGPTKVLLEKSNYQYISLLPISKKVKGIDTQGLKYTLENGELRRGFTLGMSNEIIAEPAMIHIQSGKALLIETSD